MVFLAAAATVLAVILVCSLFVDESVGKKVGIFMALGGLTAGGLFGFAHSGASHDLAEVIHHTLHHVYLVDYVQFIMLPLATVLIASMNLFKLNVLKGTKLGWFLWLGLFLIGNFATTWAVVPVALSLVPVLKQQYPARWKYILVACCVFSMNMLALVTLAADPPQAFLAIKMAAKGTPIGFFYPLERFWVYILFTLGLYLVVLKRLGVEFGNISNILGVRPASWPKAIFGLFIAGSVAFAVTKLQGYQVTMMLGAVCFVACMGMLPSLKIFGHEERHNSLHWGLETATIFVAFFSVVALAMVGFTQLPVSNTEMILVVIGETLGADNAAAFATGYPQYEALPGEYMDWYALFNSIVYGGLSPYGNGPQIAFFLVIMVSMLLFKAKEVFVIWLKEACVYAPYLLIWTCASAFCIEQGWGFGTIPQILTGIVAFAVAGQMMDLQRTFRMHVDSGVPWDGRPHEEETDAEVAA